MEDQVLVSWGCFVSRSRFPPRIPFQSYLVSLVIHDEVGEKAGFDWIRDWSSKWRLLVAECLESLGLFIYGGWNLSWNVAKLTTSYLLVVRGLRGVRK
jgi:hypothetical protein